jgi:hypothetical protein
MTTGRDPMFEALQAAFHVRNAADAARQADLDRARQIRLRNEAARAPAALALAQTVRRDADLTAQVLLGNGFDPSVSFRGVANHDQLAAYKRAGTALEVDRFWPITDHPELSESKSLLRDTSGLPPAFRGNVALIDNGALHTYVRRRTPQTIFVDGKAVEHASRPGPDWRISTAPISDEHIAYVGELDAAGSNLDEAVQKWQSMLAAIMINHP